MAKTGETILILGVVVIGGIIAIKFLPQLMAGRTTFTNLPGIFGLTRQQYAASPTTPGAIQPNTGNKPTPTTRAQSSGGGVGGPGYVVPGTPKSSSVGGGSTNKCPNGKSFAGCLQCKGLCNSPGTFDACCKANYAKRAYKNYMRWSYNSVKDRIIVI